MAKLVGYKFKLGTKVVYLCIIKMLYAKIDVLKKIVISKVYIRKGIRTARIRTLHLNAF
jgi:hypothetical protein